MDGAVNLESFAGIVQVDQGAPSRLRDHLQRALHHLVAIAERGAEDIPRQAV